MAFEQASAPRASRASTKRGWRILFAGCLAHLVHDGLTDMLYVFFPVWQQIFSLGFTEVGLLKTLFSGAMAGFQVPAGRFGNRLGIVPVLVAGTVATSLGLAGAGSATAFPALGILLVLAGIGSSAQHPLASSAICGAYGGQQCRAALSAYNFTGDIGKLLLPGLAALLVARHDWQTSIRVLGLCGLFVALIEAVTLRGATPSSPRRVPPDTSPPVRSAWFPRSPAFASLCAIGILDSATRVGLLTYLPFLLQDKGADMSTLGLALGLLFAGGAAGKLVCGILASHIGILRCVVLTESATASGILCLLGLGLPAALCLCPFLGVVLNGTSSVLYGSVPELVEPAARNEAFAFFYTGGIGAGAVAPICYGLLGDAAGLRTSLTTVALMVLLTLPCALPLRGRLTR